MVARAVVAGSDDGRVGSMLQHPLDSSRIELGSVGEYDEGRVDVVAERSEPAAQRRARPALPVWAAHDAHRETELVERVGALDHDDLADRGLREALEHGGQEDELLRRAVAGRRARRQHDGPDQEIVTVACSISTTSVGCSLWSPSLPIRSTTSRPSVTLPMIA